MSAVTDFDSQYEMVTSLVSTYLTDSANFLDALWHIANMSPVEMDSSFLELPDLPSTNLGLGNVADPDAPDIPEFTFPDTIEPPEVDLSTEMSTEAPPTTGRVVLPIAPELAIPDGEPGNLPDAPSVELPTKPEVEFPNDPTLIALNLPTVPSFTFPDAPSTDLPSLEDYGLNESPDVQEVSKEINGALADLKLMLPEVTSSEWSELKETLRSRGIALDSPVMPQNVLDEIVNMGREQFDRTVLDKQEELLSVWSGKGFTLPVGTAARQMAQLTDEITMKRWDFERDLVHKEFDMTREDMKHYTTEYGALLKYFLDAHIRYLEALLKGKSEIFRLALQSYQVRADLYKTAVEAVRMKVEIYTAIMQAEKTKLDVYLAQIEAEKAKGQINQQLIDLYKAKLSGVQVRYEVYAKEIEAQNTLVTMYRNQVEAYTALVQAYTLKFQIPELQSKLYLAKLQGVNTQLEVTKTNVSIWEATVDGQIKLLDARIKAMQAQIEMYKGKVAGYTADINGKRALVEAKAQVESLKSQNYANKIQKYKADIEAKVAEANNTREANKLRVQSLVEKAKLAERQFEAVTNARLEDGKTRAQVAIAGGNISSTVIASALNSLNAMVQLVESAFSTS